MQQRDLSGHNGNQKENREIWDEWVISFLLAHNLHKSWGFRLLSDPCLEIYYGGVVLIGPYGGGECVNEASLSWEIL